MARLTGISARAIGQYASGTVDPTRSKIIALANAVGVNVLWLITGEGPMKGPRAQADRAKEAQPIYTTNYDELIESIVGILVNELPEAKPYILKILHGRLEMLHGRSEIKEGLEALGLDKFSEEEIRK